MQLLPMKFLTILLSSHNFPWHESNWIDPPPFPPFQATAHVTTRKKHRKKLFDDPPKGNCKNFHQSVNYGITVFETATVSVNGVTNFDPRTQRQFDPDPNQAIT
jgi:hypothetical protein